MWLVVGSNHSVDVGDASGGVVSGYEERNKDDNIADSDWLANFKLLVAVKSNNLCNC